MKTLFAIAALVALTACATSHTNAAGGAAPTGSGGLHYNLPTPAENTHD